MDRLTQGSRVLCIRQDPSRLVLSLQARAHKTGAALLGIGRIGLARESNAAFDAMIARHAKGNDVPESLIRRVIWRESKYNPGLVGRGNAMGLMQIKPATAREVGFD